MATNGSSENRLSFLEKAFLEDRKRWKRRDEHERKTDERIARLYKEILEVKQDIRAIAQVLRRHIEGGGD